MVMEGHAAIYLFTEWQELNKSSTVKPFTQISRLGLIFQTKAAHIVPVKKRSRAKPVDKLSLT